MMALTDNILFLMLFSSGAAFIIAGFLMQKFPPKNINGFYGYRTSNSMKSQERWDFAQPLAAKELIRYGIMMAVLGALCLSFSMTEKLSTIIGTVLVVIFIIMMGLKVEGAIKDKFPE